jgi:hypothetical protein
MREKAGVTPHPWGMPGEEHKVIEVAVFQGASGPSETDIRGERDN